MEHVIQLFIIYMMLNLIKSYPVESEVAVKSALSKRFGLYLKTPQNTKRSEESRREIVTKFFYPPSPKISAEEVKNGVPKLLTRCIHSNDTERTESRGHNMSFLNVPLISQPYDDYNILVATAPADVNIGLSNDKKKVIVYVVFSDNGTSDPKSIDNIPKIFFVNERVTRKFNNIKAVDPILIVNNNRTVTQLKSKDIAKIVSFKNKLTKYTNTP